MDEYAALYRHNPVIGSDNTLVYPVVNRFRGPPNALGELIDREIFEVVINFALISFSSHEIFHLPMQLTWNRPECLVRLTDARGGNCRSALASKMKCRNPRAALVPR